MNLKSLATEMNSEHSKQPPRSWKHRYKHVWNDPHKLISFAVVSCLVTGLFGALISTPSNIAVLKGQEVAFNCSTNTMQKLLWYVLLPGTTSEELIFDGFHANERICFCSVKQSNQESTLYLPANESTAARYKCGEMYNGPGAIAQLTVLESDPICDDNSTEDIVSLTCVVNFSGHWSPVVEWMQIIGKEEKEVMDEVETTQTVNQFGRIVTLVNVLSVVANKSAAEYKYTVKFSSSNKPKETTAENVPMYKFSWTWLNKEVGWNETATEHGEPGDDARNLAAIAGIVAGSVATVALLAIVVFFVVWRRKPNPLQVVQVPLHEGGKDCAETSQEN